MFAMQSCIAKYHCFYTQGAVAFIMPGVFFLTHPVELFFLPALLNFVTLDDSTSIYSCVIFVDFEDLHISSRVYKQRAQVRNKDLYFRGRNFRGQKLSRLTRFLAFLAKVSAKA